MDPKRLMCPPLFGSGAHDDDLLISHDYDGHFGAFKNSVRLGTSVAARTIGERDAKSF